MGAGGCDAPFDRTAGHRARMPRSDRIVPVLARWLALVWISLLQVAGATGFVGDGACASCHPAQWQLHAASQHAKALLPINDSPLPGLLMARPLRERGGVAYAYEPVDAGLEVTVRTDGGSVSALLEWAFGGGIQGMTPVGRYDGKYFEHRVSYYPARGNPAITIGHPLGSPQRPRNGLGLFQDTRTITRCFRCHATGVTSSGAGPNLDSMTPGVRCERCHGPGAGHLAAASAAAATGDQPIRNPGRRNARRITEMCGECHRLPAPGMLTRIPEKADPFNVRFQPMGLMASRCFSRSRALSCITCHDPHSDASHDSSFYMDKCLGCHTAADATVVNCKRPVQQDCLPCHMPRTSPSPHLFFTDHRIRVQ